MVFKANLKFALDFKIFINIFFNTKVDITLKNKHKLIDKIKLLYLGNSLYNAIIGISTLMHTMYPLEPGIFYYP